MVSSRHAEMGIGLGSGTLSMSGQVVAGVIAIAFTEPLVSDPLGLPAFGTPLEAVASLGMGFVFGAPLLVGAWSCYAVGTGRGNLRTVATGILLGGLVHGTGFAVGSGAAFMPWAGPEVLLQGMLVTGVIFAGTGAVGALAGDLLVGYVGPAADPASAPR